MSEIRYAELFAGVGGFREGIEQASRFVYQVKTKRVGENITQGLRVKVSELNHEGDTGLGTCSTRCEQYPEWGSPRQFNCVYANEFDKHAAAVYRHSWGTDGEPSQELKEGDIREQNTDEIPDIDLLTAGFPCQSFSVAGKLGGFQDTRGTLFFEVARVLADKRPRHFLLENVKGLLSHDGGKTFQIILKVLTDLGYRIEWEVLNSTCWVPQNRERVFIVGHLRRECGCQVFPLREDEGVYPGASGQDKVANCLDSNYWKGWLDKGQRTMVMSPAPYDSYRQVDVPTALGSGAGRFRSSTCSVVAQDVNLPSRGCEPHEAVALRGGASHNYQKVVSKVPGGGFADNRICGETAPTLMGRAKGDDGHQSGISHRCPIVVQRRGGYGYSTRSGESPTLPGQGGTGGVDRVPNVSVVGHSRSNGKDDAGKIGIEYHLKDDVGCLKQPSGNQQDYVVLPDSAECHRFRRLTPTECERLQGWRDDHTAIGLYRATDLPKSKRNGSEYEMALVSDTQRYRAIGNGVTADVVREVIKKMIQVGCFGD